MQVFGQAAFQFVGGDFHGFLPVNVFCIVVMRKSLWQDAERHN